MSEYIQADDLIELDDSQLEAMLAETKSKMDAIGERPAPAEFWTHAANSNTIFQQLSRRKHRRERD